MKIKTYKTVRIVDLSNGTIVEYNEFAAGLKLANNERYAMPEEVELADDATEEQKCCLREAIAFNKGETIEVKEVKPEVIEPKEPETIITIDTENNTTLDFESMTEEQLLDFAIENNIDLGRSSTTKGIIKKIKESL